MSATTTDQNQTIVRVPAKTWNALFGVVSKDKERKGILYPILMCDTSGTWIGGTDGYGGVLTQLDNRPASRLVASLAGAKREKRSEDLVLWVESGRWELHLPRQETIDSYTILQSGGLGAAPDMLALLSTFEPCPSARPTFCYDLAHKVMSAMAAIDHRVKGELHYEIQAGADEHAMGVIAGDKCTGLIMPYLRR